jgi:4-amino-4-deoxy-L-arabinose transferase-like glycosyltransferase
MTRETFTPSRLILIAIMALAAITRLGWPAITEFKADEARLYALALNMAEFKGLALRGIGSSVGFPNFPMSVWLFSIPLFFWKHPYAATLFVGLLNTLAVYVCYRLVKRYWGQVAGLTAALMFAASPWAIIYSRKIWAQDLLPLFVLGYIGTALAGFVEGRKWALLWHLVFLAIVVQIHLSGVALIPVTALLFVIFWKRTRAAWKEIGLGGLVGVLTALPFGIWLLQHANGNTSILNGVLRQPATYSLDSVQYAWLVWNGFDIHSLAGPNAFQAFLSSVPNIDWVRWVWGLLTVAGVAVAVKRHHPEELIVLLWAIVPVLFFIRHSTPVFPHYFIITLPAAYVLAGIFVGWLAERYSKWTQGAVGVVGATAVAQAGVWLALLFFIGSHDTTGGFGTPLGSSLATVEAAQKANAAGLETLVVGEGDDPAVSEFPAVMGVLLGDAPHRFVNGLESAVIPEQGAVVLLQSLSLPAATRYYSSCDSCALLYEDPRGPAVVVLAAGANVTPPNVFPEPRQLANGVTLLGWEAEPSWAVYWQTGYVPAAANYHFFNHAANAQADGVGFPSSAWHDGDTVISFFDLQPVSPVRVGMYEFPSVKNVPVMDEAGNEYSDALTAGK